MEVESQNYTQRSENKQALYPRTYVAKGGGVGRKLVETKRKATSKALTCFQM